MPESRALTQADLKSQIKVFQPTLILQKVAQYMAEDTDTIIKVLFDMAAGRFPFEDMKPAVRLGAIKEVLKISGVHEAVKQALKAQGRGRPTHDGPEAEDIERQEKFRAAMERAGVDVDSIEAEPEPVAEPVPPKRPRPPRPRE